MAPYAHATELITDQTKKNGPRKEVKYSYHTTHTLITTKNINNIDHTGIHVCFTHYNAHELVNGLFALANKKKKGGGAFLFMAEDNKQNFAPLSSSILKKCVHILFIYFFSHPYVSTKQSVSSLF